jgi:ubiquinone/menaquinone biosynthesis C-methylase UbiE
MSTQQLPLEPVDTGYRDLDLRVLDCVKIQAWERILFVQCGDGWIVEEAWRRAQRAYLCGLDTSPAQVDLARRLREVPGKLEFRLWDGHCLPVPDGAFGRVVLNLTRTQPHAAGILLCEVHRVLQASGEVYLLSAASCAGDLRDALAAWPTVLEMARWGSPEVVLVSARGSLAAA